jgi:hypothetical protein
LLLLPQAGRCNHGDEPSSSINATKFLGQQNEYQMFTENSVTMVLAVCVPLLHTNQLNDSQTYTLHKALFKDLE